MSQAQPHALLMDRVYRHQRYVYDFSRKYYLFGRDSLIRSLALKPGERLVEIGCGTGRNLVHMARLYPLSKFYGIDISEEMLKSAAQSLARARFTQRIALTQAPAEAIAPELFGLQYPFDRILFSYSLSMIPDCYQALKSASQALSPKGLIHLVDFGDLTGLGLVGQRLMQGWLHLFHVSPRTELLQRFESLGAAGIPIDLHVLPMRYAFHATLRCDQAAELANNHVAR